MLALSLDPRYDPDSQKLIATWVAQLDDQTRRLKEFVGNVALEWQREPGCNTIGMLLAHLAVVEIWWIKIAPVFAADREKLDEFCLDLLGIRGAEDGIPLPPGGAHPQSLRHKTLPDYFAMLDRARTLTHEVLLSWRDDELEETYTAGEHEVTKAWTLYHVLEHFACHFGQIRTLRRDQIEEFLTRAGAWALRRNDVIGLALVGSHARGQARPDSDIDLVVVAERPQNLLANAGWVRQMGNVGSWVDAFIIEPGDTGASRRKPAIEDWGRVQSVRIHYDDGPEVEFGVTGADWALEPDEATLDVVRAGMRILYDRDGSLASMLDR